MASGEHITFFGAACTFSILNMAATVFQVACFVSTTVNVRLTSTTEESVISNTSQVPSGTATIQTKHNRKTTTAHPLPSSITDVQNGSTPVSHNEKPGDEKGFNSIVIWIIIGSGAGVLVIIVGVVISCLVRRHRKSCSEADNEVQVSDSHPTYCGLTGGDNRVYDHIDNPHQDKDYYNVPGNSDYQNP